MNILCNVRLSFFIFSLQTFTTGGHALFRVALSLLALFRKAHRPSRYWAFSAVADLTSLSALVPLLNKINEESNTKIVPLTPFTSPRTNLCFFAVLFVILQFLRDLQRFCAFALSFWIFNFDKQKISLRILRKRSYCINTVCGH